MLNRQSFKQAAAIKTKVVHIPAWNDSVCIRQLSGDDLKRLSKKARALQDEGQIETQAESMAESIIASVVDEQTGEYVFTEADLPEIKTYSVVGIVELNKAINVFNGFSQEDAVKN